MNDLGSTRRVAGRCLCGEVTYSSDDEPIAVVLCHCDDCQRSSGGAFSVNVAIGTAGLSFEGGTLAEYETVGEDTGAARQRKFCRGCGSQLATFMSNMPDVAVIKGGTLDDRSWLEPQVEIWRSSAQPWVAFADSERGQFDRGLPG